MATIARDVILCTMKLAVLGLKVLFYQCYNFWALARASVSYPVWERIFRRGFGSPGALSPQPETCWPAPGLEVS